MRNSQLHRRTLAARELAEVTALSAAFTGLLVRRESVAAIRCLYLCLYCGFHRSACVLLTIGRPHPGTSECATDRKRCDFAKGSVKFRNVREEQESRRTRTESWLDNNNKPLRAFEHNEQQPGRILETVNSDNKKI